MKKALIILGTVFALLLGTLVALPYFFKEDIVAAVKQAANEQLTAKLDFSDVDISVFRDFPNLSVGLENISIVNGPGNFDQVELLKAARLDVAVNLWDAIFNNTIVIKGLTVNTPDIKVYALSNGEANYDITKPAPDDGSKTSPIQLDRYEIINGNILYDDRASDMTVTLKGLNHVGKGNMKDDVFDLDMATTVNQMSLDMEGIKYLSKARLSWDAVVNADMGKSRYTLKKNVAQLNDLTLNLDGWIEMPNETDMVMDLTFGTPENDFKSLLSIIPGAFTQDFANVKTDGSFTFSGAAKGLYNEKNYPNFQIKLNIANANLQYPSLPMGITGINVDLGVNSPGPTLNSMVVDIPRFALKVGSNPLEGRFNLRTPMTDPNVDAALKGVLNLQELSKAFPMEGVTTLAGIIRTDVAMKGAMSSIDQQRYEQVNIAGSIDFQNLNYVAVGSPALRIQSLSSTFSPQRVTVDNMKMQIGKSDLSGSGEINNVLAYFSTTKTMTGRFDFNSNLLDANELMGPEEPAGTVPNDVPSETEAPFAGWDFLVSANANRILYDVYKLDNVRLNGHFTPNKMDITDFGMKIGESDISGNGNVLNAWNYLFDNQTVEGTINLKSNYFDLNQFMTEEPAQATQQPVETGVVPVPENMRMTINADMAKVKYTNMDLNNLNGAIVVKDRTATLKDCTAGVLGGLIALSGAYSTADLAKPAFNMDVALQNMGFKQAFTQFETVKKMAPIAQLIDGKFNTTLTMSGILGKDMMPDFTTLSAAGFLETITAIINNFKPLNMVGEKLNIEYLKQTDLSNTKNWFEIKDGQVTLKPFDVKMRDVAMRIGGTHGINSDMNYQITTKVPRKAMGNAANAGINYLSAEASKYGVSLAQGEYINTRFDLTGSMFSPKIGVKVLGSDGQATMQDEVKASVADYTEKAKDSLTNVANRELDKAKEKANAAAEKLKDTVGKVVDQKVNEAAQKAGQAAKEQAGKVLGEAAGQKVGDAVGGAAGQKAGEVVGDKGKKTVEEAQDKLKKWDPFKKKKE